MGVAECGSVPECAADETPTRVKDDSGAFACPTCKRPKAVCEAGCTGGKICVHGTKNDQSSGGSTTAGECRGKKAKKLKLRAKSAANKAFLQEASAEEVRTALVEVVDRFCDNEANAARCEKFQETLTGGMVVRKVEAKADETDVEVDVPEAQAAASRRLADDDDAESLLDAALGDPDATGGDIEISFDDGAADGMAGNNGQSRLAYSLSVMVLCGAVLPLLLV